MGKRSDFERIEKDFYPSIDPRIGISLKPFVIENSTYYEPCVGQGDLINQLDYLDCVGYSDEEKPAELLTKNDIKEADLIITNPPWDRKLLHPIIENLANLTDTWLIFDADWMHTKQSSYLVDKYCTDIVSIGRLVWIPGTRVSGKDNCCWYKFSKNKQEVTKFHGR